MVKRYCRSQKNCLFSGDFTHHWFHLRIQKVIMWSMMMMLLSFYCSYTRITQFSNFYGKYVKLKAVKSSSLNHFFWMHNQKWVHEMAHRKPFQQMSGINYYMMELQWIIAQFDKEYHYCTTVLKDELQPHTHTHKKLWHTWKSFFSHYHFKWTGHQRNMKCFTVEQSTEKNEAK